MKSKGGWPGPPAWGQVAELGRLEKPKFWGLKLKGEVKQSETSAV